MSLSRKQQAIMDLIKIHKQITKQQVVALIGNDYYHNAEKYVGEILSNMVKSGTLIRVKNGVFQIGLGKSKKTFTDETQNKLF